MLRKKTTLVLSTYLASLGLGLAALACGESDIETGRFADRAFASPTTQPANFTGALLRFDKTADVAFAPGGRHLITVDADTRRLHVYRIGDGAEVECVMHGDGGVLSADGRFAITNHQGTTLLWNVRTALFIDDARTLLPGNTVDISGFSADGSMAWVVPHNSNQVLLFNSETGKQAARLEGHADRINTVGISPDNKHVITGSGREHKAAGYGYSTYAAEKALDNSCRIWDAATAREIQCTKTAKPVNSTRFVGNSRAAYFFAQDKHPNVIELPQQNPPAADALPTLQQKATALVHKFTFVHGPDARVLDTRDGPWFAAATLSIDGKRAVYCLTGERLEKGGRMVVYDLPNGTPILSAESKDAYQQSATLSLNGKWLLTRDSHDTTTLWALPH